MKRMIISVLILVMVLSPLSIFTATATGTEPTMTVGNSIGQAGDNVDVVVSVTGNPGICTFALSINYDTSYLNTVGVDINPAWGGQFNYATKAVWVAGANVTNNDVLMTIHFHISDTALQGDYPVSVSYTDGDISNYSENDVSFETVPGKISVTTEPVISPITDFDIIKEGNEITITEYNGSDAEVNIASHYEIDGTEYTVTSITGYSEKVGKKTYYYGAFMDNTTVEKIIIPDTVTAIGDVDSEYYAFYGCTSLKDITIYGTPTIAEATLGMYYDNVTETDISVSGLTIHAWTGDEEHKSTVQTYATANGISFEGLEDVKFRCYQTTDMNGEKFKIRFVGTLDSLNYQNVGFEITETTNSKKWTSASRNVYSELYGRTADNTVIASKKATDYENSACLFAATINGIPTGTALEFTVRAYVINNIGAKIYDDTCNLHITSEGVITNDWN